MKYCNVVYLGWSIGAKGKVFPKEAGMPMGNALNPKNIQWVNLEVHWDNPKLEQKNDQSGLNIYYTANKRVHDIGMIYIGTNVTDLLDIPPN